MFRLDDPHLTPAVDPVSSLLTGGSGKVTQAVFVDDRLVMRGGKVAGMDMAAARDRAQAQFERLIAKYPDRSWKHPPVEALFTPSFPIL
ncbi:hypothetical protein [Pseudorhodobacter sp.]|uniref:hypothetical protein n=1 Tax=Pseudorhodobacter sp. TaxID=1934400 RepID=UPI00264944FF|nr:hypothetical protein [Pseudorhodobacter sp.]MDN5787830.1 hypothetical protein [Pseudorhodobacter sp.]